MMIGQEIRRQKSSLSFEFFPPKDEAGEDRLFGHISKLAELNPTYVSVTYGAGGGTRKNTRRVIQRLLKETSLEPMPHLTCVDQNADELKEILKDYRKLGVENILALRGDPPQGQETFIAPENGYCYARNLVQMASDMRMFSIAVAVYPEGHPESPSLEKDIEYTKEKIDAGADFGITQMFFNNRHYYEFLERAVKAHIDIPLIPGIMPITDLERTQVFAKRCDATIPNWIIQRFEKAGKDPDEMKKVGVEVATEQCQDLLAHGVPYLHFYTLNRSEEVTQVVRNLNFQYPADRAKHR